MVTFPPCKINLGLQVLSKQPDGYHTISTCFYPLPWTDVLEILPSDSMAFTQTGIVIPGRPEDNLCMKAYHLVKQNFNLAPVQIHLHKIIPAGAGLGGGSSDGAHTVRLLNIIFSLGLLQEQLMQYASRLGSDCSFFIQDGPMTGKGRGNILEPVPVTLRGFYLRLFKPEIHISTAEAYANVDPQLASTDLQKIIEKPVHLWKDELRNDFEAYVFKKFPLIQQLKNELYEAGAVYASMSGSGSSVFGIFRNDGNGAIFSMKESWSGWL